MKARTIVLPSLAIALCLLSATSFLPSVFATTNANSANASMAFNGAVVASQSAVTPATLPTYDLTVHWKPTSVSIAQSASSSCSPYPVCGSASLVLTLKNAGTSSFKTNGKCKLTVTPGPNGKKSESFPCSGFPVTTIKAGAHKSYSDTFSIYNWPDGTYKVHFFVQGKVGTTTEKSKTGTFTVVASGNP